MTVEEFKHYMERFWRAGKSILADRGQHAPQLLAFNDKDELLSVLIELPFQGAQLFPAAQAVLRRHRAVAYVSIGESWMLAVDKPKGADPIVEMEKTRAFYKGKVHLQPNKTECLWMNAVHTHRATPECEERCKKEFATLIGKPLGMLHPDFKLARILRFHHTDPEPHEHGHGNIIFDQEEDLPLEGMQGEMINLLG